MISTAANEITLDWNGGDIDNNITGYDLYFGYTKRVKKSMARRYDRVTSLHD